MRILSLFLIVAAASAGQRWPEQKAQDWYAKQPWMVGANYVPATAINQIEMWQAATFDPKRIELELGWAAGIGMNTMRVFLHDLLWNQEPDAYKKRIETLLAIAAKHGIRIMPVLFDSVWDPNPKLGPQRAPRPGVHNSGWVQGPGAEALRDPRQHARLEAYVKGVVSAFAQDPRIVAWDLWNEPDNPNTNSYGKLEPADKVALVLPLLEKTFAWARSAKPSQPLTSGVWRGEWTEDKLDALARLQLEQSDVISFHSYETPDVLERRIQTLQRLRRPLLCTEYMARGNGSTFEGSLPVLKKYRVAAINWGLVEGKAQTHLPWDSWKAPYVGGREPAVWFHEVFRRDGTPYRPEEAALIRKLTAR